jgi:hypothetical protein
VGAAASALVVALAACGVARSASADPQAPALPGPAAAATAVAEPRRCTGFSPETETTAASHYATCFDPGNRLVVDAGTAGFGGAIELRHAIHFADAPGLVWKMEHALLDVDLASYDGSQLTGRVYRGVYIRHAPDGHVVLPFGDPPAKLWLPFDVGALVEVGALTWRPDATATVGVVKTAALVDLARSKDHHLRLALGPVASWDIDLARNPSLAVVDHVVAPFTSGLVDVRFESAAGLDIATLRVESGVAWYGARGWLAATRAEASLERTVLSVNDRPVAVVAQARYDSARSEASVAVGLRVALIQHRDPRVHVLASR